MRVGVKEVRGFCLLFLALLVPLPLRALPIGFGTTPGNLDYQELKSKNFYLYHDARTPQEAKLTLNALEAARPILEKWLAVHRSRPLPVIMSATTDGASFANFITDAIEIQTMGQGSRDLAWHEYVHSTMYRHFDNWLGPAGSILHLMWMPSWWVEGLAEALSVSIGSDEAASIERYHALSGDWPTYARMHSLYASDDFSYRGYATSGAFVAYILRQLKPHELPDLLNSYFYRSMPWVWPYSILPLETSMPLDQVLVKFLSKTGEQLYEDYKKAAAAYWQARAPHELLSKKNTSTADFGNMGTIAVHGQNVFKVKVEDYTPYWSKVQFDQNGWGKNSTSERPLPGEMQSLQLAQSKALQITAFPIVDARAPKGFQLESATGESDRRSILLKRAGIASSIITTSQHVLWREEQQESARLCYAPRHLAEQGKYVPKGQIECLLETRQPKLLHVIGTHYRFSQNQDYVADSIWVKVTEQTLYGNRFELYQLTIAGDGPAPNGSVVAPRLTRINTQSIADPVQVARAGQDIWVLSAEANARTLRKITPQGQCSGQAELADFVVNLFGFDSGDLLLGLRTGDQTALTKINPSKIQQTSCTPPSTHTSPLLIAMNQSKTIPELHSAIAAASFWQTPPAARVKATAQTVAQAKPANADELYPDDRIDQKSQPAQWRPRPVFAVPWIGADSGGTQLGILSVPLMDHMQNEEVRLYLAYGPESRFPHSEVSLRSSRFWPELGFDAFRYQTWNGVFIDTNNNNQEEYAYIDERGVRASASTYIHAWKLDTIAGIKVSELKHYHGPTQGGTLVEPFVALSRSTVFGPYTWSKAFSVRVAPPAVNTTYEYNAMAASTGVTRALPFWSSTLALDLEGSRTRGSAMRELKEFYRPLKIFVPGSGGGLNNLSFPLTGCCGLFTAHYGENQGRARLSYLVPVIEHVDKLVRLFYWDRLDASADYNYGGAWNGSIYPESEDDLILSHNYNLTARFDVKGVNFTAGGGVGQVMGSNLQSYLTFSFDAVF